MFDNPLNLLMLGIAVIVLFVIVRTLWRFFWRNFQPVPEGQMAVVERMNRFHRVGGPGDVWVMPKFERVAHRLQIRTQGEHYRLTGLWTKGMVPVDIDMALSYRRDFGGLDQEQLKRLAYYPDHEFRALTQSQIVSILHSILPRFEFGQLLGPDLSFQSDFYATLLDALNKGLRSFGVVLDKDHGLILEPIRLPPGLRESLISASSSTIDADTRRSIIAQIMRDYPGFSEAYLLSLIGVLTGQPVNTTTMLPPLILSGPNSTVVLPTPTPMPGNPSPSPQNPATPVLDDQVYKIIELPPGDQK